MSATTKTPPASLHAAELIESMGDPVFELSADGVHVGYLGPRERSPIPPDRLLGRSVHDVWPSDVAAVTARVVRDVCAQRAPASFECSLPSPIEPRYYEVRVVPGVEGHAFAIVRDIHARRTAENQLRESEERFRLMADHAPVMLWKANRQADCDFFNRGWLDFTGRPLEAELGLRWAEGVHPEDFQYCAETYLSAFVARASFRMEYRLRRADGAYRWILDSATPRFDPDGSFAGYVGSCIDVTDMREASERIKTLNGELHRRVLERESLLREIHHRVKNNLQLISSLLSLQARLLDGDARCLIEDGQTRVHAIALAHEKLCETEDMTEVDLMAYSGDIVRTVRRAIGDASRVELELRGERLSIGVDQAIPCGLIINELVTNTFKHAFPDGRAGRLSIEVTPLDDRRVRLVVADDGAGLPPDIDLRQPRSLGLDLVATLARQLGASLEILRMGGTTFVLTFPLARSKHDP